MTFIQILIKNKTMKNLLLPIMVIALFIGACGNKNTGTPAAAPGSADKVTKLAEIKKQIADLEKQATALEKEINPEGIQKENLKVVEAHMYPVSVFKNYIDLQGSVKADQELFINAKMAGTADNIYMKTGDHVGAGQTVLTLDDAILKQGLAELEQQLSFANDLFEKQKALWDQKLGTEVQYLSAKNNKESIEKRIATTKEQWELTKVKAPVSGVIDEVMVKPGMTVMPGSPMARLVNTSKLKISAEVPEAFAGKIKTGNPIRIVFPDINKEFDSKVTYVSPVINNVNRTFKVEAQLPANMQGVLPNMLTIIKIADYTNPKAVVIPINLLQKDNEGDFVMTIDTTGGHMTAAKTPVTIGKFYHDQAEIKSGLSEKSKVITVGYQELIEGQKLSVQIN